MFVQHGSFAKPRIGKPMGLQRGHIDHATLTLTFIYYELVHDGAIWENVERQQVLVLNQHYRIDKRKGIVELLDDPFWHTLGLWRAGDREEELLYKGRVKHPQRIDFAYEHYTPEPVNVLGDASELTGLTPVRKADGTLADVDMDSKNTEANTRLGYELPEYGASPESFDTKPLAWDWEPDVVITP